MTRGALLIAGLAAPLVAFAAAAEAPPHLLFSAEEAQAVEEALARHAGKRTAETGKQEPEPVAKEPPPPDIHLSSLLYASPEKWTAWINGERITPGVATGDFLIGRVQPRRLEVVLTEPEGKRVWLSPHQTYRRDLDAVVEGR